MVWMSKSLVYCQRQLDVGNRSENECSADSCYNLLNKSSLNQACYEQERMSRRRRRRSVQLVKTVVAPHTFWYHVSQLALVQLWLHKVQFVFHTYLAQFHTNPYNCVCSGLLLYKVKFWRCEGLLLVLGRACGVGRSFAAFCGSCAPVMS